MASNKRRLITLSSRALGVSVAASLAAWCSSDAEERERNYRDNGPLLGAPTLVCCDANAAPEIPLNSHYQLAPNQHLRHRPSEENQVDSPTLNSLRPHEKNCFPNLSRHGKDSLLAKYLTPDVYDMLKDKQTRLGVTLEDIIRGGVALPWGARPPRGIAGVFAGDAESYQTFAPLLDPLIQEHHRAGRRKRLRRHQSNLDYKGLLQQQIDPKGEYILYTRMRLARSLVGFRFAPCIGRAERREVQELLRDCAKDWTKEHPDGDYLSLMDMSNAQHQQLVQQQILFQNPDEFAISAGLARDWPDGRGIYCDSWRSGDLPNLMIWCNAQDHFWIVSNTKGGDVQGVFTRLSLAVFALETSLNQRGHAFVEDRRLGFLNTCPVDIGTALRASVYVKLVRLGQRPEFQDLLRQLRLEARPVMQTDTSRYNGIFDIANMESLGKSEVELINIMIRGVGTLIELEKKLENGEEIDPLSVT